MANPQTADQFMHLLKRSGLLSQEEVEALPWRYKLRDLESGKEIAKTLVRNNELTVFQARRILHGSSRGLRLGKYRVLDLLGSGGMGFVYLGQEDETDWKVALKVLSSRYRLDGGMKSRFQLEAEAGLKLRHPHIVRTHGIDKTEDIYGEIHYIAMEFIRGVSLFELIRLNKQLPWGQACDIIRQAALGLEFAHRHEMIHRDIKPENILIRSDGSAKLMDFGLAMLDKSEDEFAMAMIHGQTCLGTADYVAPEQIKDSFAVDHRADIYSLGCTLYFALSGRVPFPVKGETKAELTYLKLKCHRKAKPKPLASICGELPSRVIAIVETMMKKLPEKRIQNAAQVAKLLEPFCERSEIEFDWDRVLKQRWKEAQKRQRILEASRLKNLSDQRSPSASHSMSTGALPTKPLSLDDPQDIPPKEDKTQTSRETLVRDDTHVEKKKKEERKEPAKERLESLEQLERTQDPDENR